MNAQPGQPNQYQPNQYQPNQARPFQEIPYQTYEQPAPPYAGAQFSTPYADPRFAAPSYGPHGYQCPPVSVNDQAGGRARTVIAAVAAALALGVGGGALLLSHTGQDPRSSAVSAVSPVAQVNLEPTASSGPSPFMTPVGTDTSGVTSPAGTAGTFAGDTAGLFAERGDKPSCDAKTLVGNLTADPAKNAAWAGALRIDAAAVPTFVDTLTPVVLRSDTAVTSYGYSNGDFTPYPAVLQAGTAVFVNSFGEPTVKCYSGNPLTRAHDYTGAGYVGPRWGHFAPRAVTYIRPTPTVIEKYTYVDVDHGGFREHHSWCWDHRDSDQCHHNPDPEPRHDSDHETDHETGPKADPALDAAAKVATAKADAAAKDAKDADTTATGLEQEANQAKLNATLFLEPQRSIEVAKAAQLDQAAQAARAAATAKAAAAKTSADDAKEADNQAAKAAGVTPDAEDGKGGGAQIIQPLAGDPAGLPNAAGQDGDKVNDKAATAPAQLFKAPGTETADGPDTKTDTQTGTQVDSGNVAAVPATGATETTTDAAGTDAVETAATKSGTATAHTGESASNSTVTVQEHATAGNTEQAPAQPETTTKSGTTTDESGTTAAQGDDN